MRTVKTKDGIEIYYKDWGKGQPIVFSHGWPLSSDDWDAQMLFFLNHGYRVIAHDRRGHGRSSQTGEGHDMDHYADDLAAVTAHLDLNNVIHVGHSTGGGEVVHYLARHGESRVAKAAILCAVPPLMVKTAANPNGLPKDVFDGFQTALAANRSQFYRDVAAGPFYGYNRPGAKPSEPVIQNWWRQGMMGGAKAHYDGIVAFSQTDFTEDLKKINVPVLVMHSEDDQIVPYVAAGPLSAKLLKNGTLKTYKDFPHGMPTTQGATINADLLAFRKGARPGPDLHIFETARLVVDADTRRRDPARELTQLGHRLHQAADEIAVVLGRQPGALVAVPGRFIDQLAGRRYFHVLELTDLAVEADMRQFEFEGDAGFVDDLVPAVEAALAIGGIIVAQPHIDRGERRLVNALDLAVDQLEHGIGRVFEPVIVADLGFLESALEPGGEGIRRIGRDFRAEQIERQRIMQIELLLHRRQIDHPELADLVHVVRILDAGSLHRLAGALDGAPDAGLPDEHVMRLFGEHEAAGA